MDTKKLEQEAYDALKRFYSATTAERDEVNVNTDDISFYVDDGTGLDIRAAAVPGRIE